MHSREPQFDYFQYEQLRKDFCYNKPLSLRVTTSGPSSDFQLQELVEVKSGKCFLTDVARLTHRFTNATLKATLAHNCVKLYYGHLLPLADSGSIDQPGKEGIVKKPEEGSIEQATPQTPPEYTEPLTIKQDENKTVVYSRLYADRKFQNASVQIGLSRHSQELQLDSNVSAFLYERQNEYFLYAKALYKGKRWSAGAISLFDFGCRNLQTNNLVLQVIPHTKHRLFLRGEVDGLRNYSLKYSSLGSYFDYLVANYVCKPTDTLTLMAEYRYDCNTARTKTIESIIQKKFPRNTVKLAVNHMGDVTFQLGLPLSLGRDSRLDFGLQVADILAARRISYGFSAHIHA